MFYTVINQNFMLVKYLINKVKKKDRFFVDLWSWSDEIMSFISSKVTLHRAQFRIMYFSNFIIPQTDE